MSPVVVVGSGAGGAVTALTLASAGRDVLVLEEGRRAPLASYGKSAPEAMRDLYRQRGMNPILGRVPIGYVEGRCLGGSTEINSGFWHRTPRESLIRWTAQFDLEDASVDVLEPHFEWAEKKLGVGLWRGPLPASTRALARGIEAMGWSGQEIPRAAPGCKETNTCAQGCPTGAKQGMSRALLPEAEAAGAKVVTGARVKMLLKRDGRITGVLVELARDDGSVELVRVDADAVFLCAGPSETPLLLQRSGIKAHVGNSFRIHPMLKVAARFDEDMDAQSSVLPLFQVKEFWPEISLGGGFFSAGHLAMLLSDNWPLVRDEMGAWRRMATYYVAVRGTGRGSVRPSLWDEGPTLRYEVSDQDVWNLSRGLGRLSALLLAAGAREVLPGVHGVPKIETEVHAARWLDDALPRSALSLTTVHAFSSCPMGERADRCAADSFGKVRGWSNLYLNDASMLPDSPGVNPQGTVMAFARRNVQRFLELRS